MTIDSTPPKQKTDVLAPGTNVVAPGRPMVLRKLAHAEEYALGAVQFIGTDVTTCQIRVTEPGVSGQHAMLAPHEDGLGVSDLHSTNGCWFRGKKCEQFTAPPGEPFRLGP